jgi:transcriptional regulator with XRE-family HTH domain
MFSITNMRGEFMSLGEMIAEKRLDKGLSQEDLGKMLDLSRSSISNYETDTHSPDIDTLRKMADILDTSADYLLERISYDVDLKELNKVFIENDKEQLLVGDFMKRLIRLDEKSRNAIKEHFDLLEFKQKNSVKS